MHTAVTKRGQTVIPAALRKRYQIGAGVHLVWLDDGETIRIVPTPADLETLVDGVARFGPVTTSLVLRSEPPKAIGRALVRKAGRTG